MSKTKITCPELLEFVPDSLLEKIEKKTKVNYQVKKLNGKIMFKLLLMSLLDSRNISLRVMEEIYSSPQFTKFSSKRKDNKTKHTTISDRLANIDYSFFEKIFGSISKEFSKSFNAPEAGERNIAKFDSTVVSLSMKLLKIGMSSGGSETKNQIKFTVGLNNNLPGNVRMFKKQNSLSENVTLKKAILSANLAENTVVVFDRGLQKRETLCKFTDEKILFITRANENINYKFIKTFKKIKGKKTSSLCLEKDMIVKLKDRKGKFTKKEFRLIISESLQTKKKLFFLTNVTDLNAKEITDIYRRRWDIEVFFKFLKQELNFKHFVSRTENGIKVMLYMTLILALLLIVYKTRNKISSYKIAKIRFRNELEMDIIKEIVILCNGNISTFEKLRSGYAT